ncbi:DUF1127 domain-containing protein [Ruegeria arenilitoris]|uniref:DUF1127 domain-containing protein n=1 Tax=Ruegeria arenilitoris TaxID=1173585 RepID=UPI00147C7CB9|nr:DUF1127 domain-containing protein [Ruegeria arenilitoris]
MKASTITDLTVIDRDTGKTFIGPSEFKSYEVSTMFDVIPPTDNSPLASALLLFDRAMRINAIKGDIVSAAQQLNGLTDHQLAELGLNRKDIEDTIDRYI